MVELKHEAQQGEPAPAQDEREAYSEWRTNMEPYGFNGADAFVAGAAWQRTRPAQTEQQPIRLPDRLPVRMPQGRTLPKGYAEAWNAALDEVIRLNAAPIAQTASQLEQSGLVEALEHARTFIRNGVELGFITMPDRDTPDPAHETLPKIECALAAYRTALAAQGGASDE